LIGDEVGRTQHGNNNAYCQDNEIAWLEWKDINERERAFMEFMRGVLKLRGRYPLLRSNRFLHSEPVGNTGLRNVVWYRPDGQEMDAAAWSDPNAKVIGLLLADLSTRLLILANAYHEAISFKLPGGGFINSWTLRIDTARGVIDPPNESYPPEHALNLEGRSLFLLAGAVA
jgi:glycogen operon protein